VTSSGRVAGDARRDERAPVAALQAELLVAEHFGHQPYERVGDLRHAEALLPGAKDSV
jgi:hypothetical protein